MLRKTEQRFYKDEGVVSASGDLNRFGVRGTDFLFAAHLGNASATTPECYNRPMYLRW